MTRPGPKAPSLSRQFAFELTLAAPRFLEFLADNMPQKTVVVSQAFYNTKHCFVVTMSVVEDEDLISVAEVNFMPILLFDQLPRKVVSFAAQLIAETGKLHLLDEALPSRL